MTTVAAVVVTYQRHEQVLSTLEAVLRQTWPPERVFVVDNGSSSELAAQVAALGSIEYIDSGANMGPGGGFNLGMRSVEQTMRPDWYWLLDDDSPPSLRSLEEALRVGEEHGDNAGLVGMRGGNLRYGRVRHDYRSGLVDRPIVAGFALVDGSIVRGEAVRRAGFPRSDFFIMMEDIEYSMRIHDAGYDLLIRPSDGSRNLYQGSGAPWRGYYQARNHLRMAIERRSLAWLFGWLVREGAVNLSHLRHRRFTAIGHRLRGARDGVRNRMGQTLAPT